MLISFKKIFIANYHSQIILSNLAENLNENFINILLQNIDKNKINEKDIDLIYNLSIHRDNKIKCCEYFYHCILKLDLVDYFQNNPIMERLVSLSGKDDKHLSKVLSMCEKDLKANKFIINCFTNYISYF